MASREIVFNILILLSIVSFGVIGSLSHIFNLAVLLLLGFHFLFRRKQYAIESNSKNLFFCLCAIFFIFFIRGFFYSDPWVSFHSLSPMFPLAVIGLMILLTNYDFFELSAARLALFAKISVFIAFVAYLLLTNGLGDQLGLSRHFLIGRLELFSGNPIPFSVSIFGITVFCFANWREATDSQRIVSIICYCLGILLAGILSGTRGTTLAYILSTPILFWYIFRSFLASILISISIVVAGWLFLIYGFDVNNFRIYKKILRGIITLMTDHVAEGSMKLRMDIWAASIKTIKEIPVFGYDISNRFIAIKPNLPNDFVNNFTHPHNDIFASVISAGFIAAPFAIISLLSPLCAALLSKNYCETKLCIGTMVTVGVFSTANVNTIFFNDITSAWLAFSVFLIWNMRSTYAPTSKH